MSRVIEQGFFSLFFPIYLERNVLQVVLLLDVIFLSSISSDAIAGVGIATPIIYTLVAMIGTVSGAVTGLMGQYIGSGRTASVANILKVGWFVGVSLGLLLAFLQIILSVLVPRYVGVSPAAALACSEYLLYMSPMLITDGIFVVAASTISVHGKPRWLLASSVTLVVTNTAINSALYFGMIPGFTLSPASIAVSTVVSQIPPILIMAYCIFFVIKIRKSSSFLDADTLYVLWKRLSSVFLPSLINPLAANITQFLIAFFLARYGTYQVAAFVFCRNILIPITTAASSAFSISAQVFVSHLQGMRDYASAKEFLNRALLLFLPLISLAVLVTAVSFPFIAGTFHLDQPVAAAGQNILFILIVAETARAAWVSLDQSLRGSGYVVAPVAAFVTAQCMIWLGGFVCVILMHQPVEAFLSLVAVIECVYALALFYSWNTGQWIAVVRRHEV